MTRAKKLGILAVQGAFVEHKRAFERLGAECVEIRRGRDVDAFDAFVLPGGESTTQGKLLRELRIFEPMKELIESGVPVFATCAGVILLAQETLGGGGTHFRTAPIVVRRNAYGRQLASFRARFPFRELGEVDGVFIRAPIIEEVAPDVEVLAYCENSPVAVRYRSEWATTFHPELSRDDRIARMFLESF